MSDDKFIAIANTIRIAIFAALGVVFKAWWIVLFSIPFLLISRKDEYNEEEKHTDEQ